MDILAEVAFLHERVRPDCIHQDFLGNYLSLVLQKHKECLEGLGREGNNLLVSKKQAPINIQSKWTKFQ